MTDPNEKLNNTLYGLCPDCANKPPPGYDERFAVRYCEHTQVLVMYAGIVHLGNLAPWVSLYPVPPNVYQAILDEAAEQAAIQAAAPVEAPDGSTLQ